MVKRCALTASLVAALAEPAAAATYYIEAGRVITQCCEPIEGGRIVVRDGKVEAVGKDVQRPPFSERIDATKQVITPGFVLPVTDLGMPSPAEGPPQEGVRVEIKPDVKAADEFAARPDHRARHGRRHRGPRRLDREGQ